MLPSRKWRMLVTLVAFVHLVPHLSAVVVESRMYHGKKVNCVHGGAWYSQRSLGAYSRARIYHELVVVGTVQSVVEISFADRRLRIVPEEILFGEIAGDITATVNQACLAEDLPEIKAGDKWLFFLRPIKHLHPDANPPYITTDGLMVDVESHAEPVSLAEYDICLLRLRSDLDESCTALMPDRPRDASVFCALELTPAPFANPFPRPSLLQEPRKSQLQEDETDMAHIPAPPEFRVPTPDTLNVPGFMLQTLPPLSCPPEKDDSGQAH